MTRAQRLREAVALRCAAEHWSTGDGRCDKCRESPAVWGIYAMACDAEGDWMFGFEIAASAALSEAARLSDTEIVDNESEE